MQTSLKACTHTYLCVDVYPSHCEYHTSAFSPSYSPCVQKESALSHDFNADNVQIKINDV